MDNLNFFDHWPRVKESLKDKDILLLLDYDGTLAPITETPDKAVMTEDMRQVLVGLSKFSQCHLAVISGRKLSDLKHMIDIPNITYIGNHGFEIEGSRLDFESLISAQYREDLETIRGLLKTKLSSVKGIWLEDKEIILAVHFRLAGVKGSSLAKKIFMNVCQSYLRCQRISIMEGKKVLEIRPPIKWDKGEAALWILSKWQQQLGKDRIVTIYIGDDLTDEDAFRILDGAAMTIKIGESGKSSAHYFLRTQEEVFILLKQILALESQYVSFD